MLRSRITPLVQKSSIHTAFRVNSSFSSCRIGLHAPSYSVKASPIAHPIPILSLRLRPLPTLKQLQSARVFSTSSIVTQTKATVHPTPVPIGDLAKHDDDADHSGASELTTDLKKVSEMFGGVPEPALLAGLVGVLPYAFASVATLLLTWDINAASHSAYALKDATASSAFWFDPQTASHWLEVLQGIQVTYGAVLLSFLGAIHWGLEFAGMGGQLGFRRYFLGILAPLLAWPTTLLPTNFALVVQFLGFTGMYYADSRATRYGWAPTWYNGYRFVLTFIVCTSIVFNLIVKEYLTDTGSTHGKLDNLKSQRKNIGPLAEPEKPKYPSPLYPLKTLFEMLRWAVADGRKNVKQSGGKKTKKSKDEDDEEDE